MPVTAEELSAAFNGAILYEPLLKDTTTFAKDGVITSQWTKDEYIQFAQAWHENAVFQLRKKLAEVAEARAAGTDLGPDDPMTGWNNGISYCTNELTPELLAEAAP